MTVLLRTSVQPINDLLLASNDEAVVLTRVFAVPTSWLWEELNINGFQPYAKLAAPSTNLKHTGLAHHAWITTALYKPPGSG